MDQAYVRHYPQVMRRPGRSTPARLLPAAEIAALGEVLFQYHCNDCHAAEAGYSAVAPMLRGRTRPMIRDMVQHLEQAHFFMPPWCGTAEEAELLTDYLDDDRAAASARHETRHPRLGGDERSAGKPRRCD